ncbi:MAG: DPP IV N-terminal domain-containing protein [Verrucomicrobiia bacterium]
MRYFICVISLFLLVGVQAQVVITGSGKAPVSIENFQVSPDGKNILIKDLQQSGVIELVGQNQARYRVEGALEGGALKSRLIEMRQNQVIFNRSYVGATRDMIHQFADDVVQAITGYPGIATTQITFISKATGAKELYVMNVDGTSVRQITRDRSISGSPSFSPDASQVAYTSYKSGYPDVYVVNLKTGQRDRVAGFPGLNSGAAFSPSGSRLALTLSKSGNPEIYTMSASGGSLVRVTKTRGAEASPSWSPNGNSLVFASDDRGSPQIYIASAQGGEMKRLNTGFLYATEPVWSPDGKKIAFNARIGGAFQICLYDLPTQQTRQLTKSSNNEDPSWARDSRHLVFSRNGQLVLLDTLSLETYEIKTGLSQCTEPSCSK